MNQESVGYIDLDGKIKKFASARCRFINNQLDVEADGPKWKLHLFGIPFPQVQQIAEISGKCYGPAEVTGDPIAEGGVEIRPYWFSFEKVEVRCRSYDAEQQLITVVLEAEVVDHESGRSATVDSSVRCQIVEKLWT